jgi:hypothetical protein
MLLGKSARKPRKAMEQSSMAHKEPAAPWLLPQTYPSIFHRKFHEGWNRNKIIKTQVKKIFQEKQLAKKKFRQKESPCVPCLAWRLLLFFRKRLRLHLRDEILLDKFFALVYHVTSA